MCDSGTPFPKLFFHFGQTVHLKTNLEGKACILKDFFFFYISPVALERPKMYKFGLSECNRVKIKTLVLSRDIKIIFFNVFLFY